MCTSCGSKTEGRKHARCPQFEKEREKESESVTCGTLWRKGARKGGRPAGAQHVAPAPNLRLTNSIDVGIIVGICLKLIVNVKSQDVEVGRDMKQSSRTSSVVAGSLWDVRKLCLEGHLPQALEVVQRADQHGLPISIGTLYHLLRSSIDRRDITAGHTLQDLIHKHGHGSNPFLCTHLIRMLSLSGNLADADRAFGRIRNPDTFAWNAIISAHADLGRTAQALVLYRRMLLQGVQPSEHIFVTVLKACSWTASLHKGYALHGPGEEALCLFWRMGLGGIEPNNVTFVSLLKACCNIGALICGKLIHSYIIESGCESDVQVGSTLIDMYAKCGTLHDAQTLFNNLEERSAVTWNSIIAGFAEYGDYGMMMQSLKSMQEGGWKPTIVTFVNLLSACSHLGLGNEASCHFKSLVKDLDIPPIIEHYNCMVDLFGRLGCLKEAEDILKTLPLEANCVGWSSLLSHCKRHGNIELGKECFNHLVTLNAQYSSGYVLMNDIFSSAGMWEEANSLHEVKECAYAWKKPGKAFIEVDNMVCNFVVGDETHSQWYAISLKLEKLDVSVKAHGYIPFVDHALQPFCGNASNTELSLEILT